MADAPIPEISQVDAGSPVDEHLMEDGVKGSLDNHETRIDTLESGRSAYAIQLSCAMEATLTDGQTMFFGGSNEDPGTANNARRRGIFPAAGRIKQIVIFCSTTVFGSAEAWEMKIKINNSIEYTIASDVTSTDAQSRTWANLALDIPVNALDYFEIVSVNPAWGTNPTEAWFSGIVKVEI